MAVYIFIGSQLTIPTGAIDRLVYTLSTIDVYLILKPLPTPWVEGFPWT